ncbi:MAG: DNA topoisomerase IV subunit A [Clostridium sp.]
MAKKVNYIPKDNNIIRVPIEEAMPDNYLPYAIEVAKERALPDVRDGLKPVHRRILFGAYQLKAYPDKPYYKSARIVGDILGKYHPHGDSSVYDAMVIMAQNFSTRAPLIDGQGNWGSSDGDGAAAMRYTEARLAPIAMEMLRDIEKDTVDMILNYSESELEPKVLPSRYPNLLVNGTFGIAVGLATNIPPHNLGEVTNGVLAYIDNPEITTKELMTHIKGPDLPTGGILIGRNSLISAYETGEGKVSLRAKCAVEKLENGRLGIVITEFPYRRNKAKMLQTISEMTGDKRHAKALESIIDIRDESDRNGIRSVIEFRKAVDEDMADKVLKYLFKKTDLQCNISFNMVALAEGKPQTMGLKTIIMHYVNHQKDIVTRRTVKELSVAEKRFHIVEGFIKAIDVLDELIKIIRASKSKKDAGENIRARFDFSEAQSDAILELMLYRLTGLEIKVFQKEYNELEKLIKKLKNILKNPNELLKVIKTELIEITDKFKDPRRTAIIEDDSEAKIDVEELIIVEDIMVTLSKDGFIKRLPLKTYNRSNANAEDIDYRDGDNLKFLVKSNTRDTLLIFTNKGNMYQTKGINIPELKWKEKGEKIDRLIRTINLDKESIVSVMSVSSLMPNKTLQFITTQGSIKKSSLDKFQTTYTKLQALKLKDNDEVMDIILLEENEKMEFLSVETKCGLKFDLELPSVEEQPRNILGLQLFNLSTKDEVCKVSYSDKMEFAEFAISVSAKGVVKACKKARKTDKLKVNTDSKSEIIMFTNLGRVYKIPAFLLQGVNKEEINLKTIIDDISKGEVVIQVYSLKNFEDNKVVYLFTKKGMIKKTYLKEFDGSYSYQVSYKFKYEGDEIVATEICSDKEAELVMLTKRGMAIKFSSENVNAMGKLATGVTGISLKEDDSVLFGKAIVKQNKSIEPEISMTVQNNMTLISKNKEKKELDIEEIKLQNRAGRGSSIMVIVLEDEIKEVIF